MDAQPAFSFVAYDKVSTMSFIRDLKLIFRITQQSIFKH